MVNMALIPQQKVILNTGEPKSFIPFGYVVDERAARSLPQVTVTTDQVVQTPMITSDYTVTHKFLPDGTVLATIKLVISGDGTVDKYEVRVSENAG